MFKRLRVRIALSAFMLVAVGGLVAPAAHAENRTSCVNKGGIIGASAGENGFKLYCGDGSMENWSY